MAQHEKRIRSDARQNKKIILESTIELSLSGIDITELKMSDIAKHAGVGIGTLYRHFESKARLCEAVMDTQVESMFQEIEVFLEEHKNYHSYQRIFGILSHFLNLKEANFLILSFIEKSSNSAGVVIHVPFYHSLAELIKSQLKEKDIENLDFKIDVMLNCFSSDFYYYSKHIQKLSKTEFLEQVLDIIL
ncbi:TetR/AcrR family transcriptional regulator [Staphylococcus cohnii species complex 1658]|uniref:TetR/AcrR family transcriptional regulator n=1 Tax=Staphylococcus cohnii species complex 1658 TaxID=3239424 RepID=UPI0034D969B7